LLLLGGFFLLKNFEIRKAHFKVLIHSGTGGVGQAAIRIALEYGCEVYTTVSNKDKREFLQQRFPQLKDHHFANSRTTDFEQHIRRQTFGRGVDVVLNSLAHEMLRASLRCLAQHGRFLEIGKVDLSQNSSLGMSLFLKNVTLYVAFFLKKFFNKIFFKSWNSS